MRTAFKFAALMSATALMVATAFAQDAAPAAPPARETPRPQDLEPGVNTSSPEQSPDKASGQPAAGAAESKPATPSARDAASRVNAQGQGGASPTTGASPAAGANPSSVASPAASANAASAQPGTAKPAARGKAQDRLELDTTQITGNRELPKVLYIVPWKRSDLGDLVGKPVNSLLDEVLTPVDRDVFQRENRYYRALTPGAAENDALSAPDGRAPTPVRSPTPTNSAPAAGSKGSATQPTNSVPTGSGSAAPPARDEK